MSARDDIIRTVTEYINENLGIDDAETIAMLWETYLETFDGTLPELTRAISAGIAADVQHSAHALKGCSANIGMEEIRALSYQLECAGRNHDLAQAPEVLNQLIALRQALPDTLEP
ncbi:Hpt domain-containing protein [Victivallis sp. Marseille-Q1083]|uniref:Hpt domain-containing protein n=1 Tax=Victivallis sp. Marseille-Q1083 TaxID=2717288 RepID=UPI00158DF9EE|nr:Hpt domain-containing protein [Victivallis sp. Marseille-Q1083]